MKSTVPEYIYHHPRRRVTKFVAARQQVVAGRSRLQQSGHLVAHAAGPGVGESTHGGVLIVGQDHLVGRAERQLGEDPAQPAAALAGLAPGRGLLGLGVRRARGVRLVLAALLEHVTPKTI